MNTQSGHDPASLWLVARFVPSLPGLGRLAAATLIVTGVLLPAGGAHADPSPQDLDRQITTANERLETLVEERNSVAADLAATRGRAVYARTRVEELVGGLDQARTRVGQVAAWAYRSGPVSQVTAVLGADSPGDFLGRLAVLDQLGRAEQGQIEDLAGQLAALRTERDDLDRLLSTQQAQQDALAQLTAQVEQDLAALRQLRARASATASRSGRSTVDVMAVAPAVSGAAGTAVAFAYAQLGKGYRYAGSGPDAYDCSGLTMAAWAAAGVGLPHNAARQFNSVPHVSRGDLRPGDLVFYYNDIHHVALYVGDGHIVHAPNDGETVRVDDLDLAPIAGYGRP
jgi:cell wall-associated NlpC family hydrolase